jgi:hypothetical protein
MARANKGRGEQRAHRCLPDDARTLTRFNELDDYLLKFAAGVYSFLWLVGRSAVGKSEAVKRAMKGKHHFHQKGGELTPHELYVECYRWRGYPIILDDMISFSTYDYGQGHRILNALGERPNDGLKEMSWRTSRKLPKIKVGGQDVQVPVDFATSSQLLIIGNAGSIQESVLSRAITLHIDPTRQEVHNEVAKWFWDQEIHDYVGAVLDEFKVMDMRHYLNAWEDKVAGRDWRRILQQAYANNEYDTLIKDLQKDNSRPTPKDKERRFMELTGQCSSSYTGRRKKLQDQGFLNRAPYTPIRVKGTPPTRPTREQLDAEQQTAPQPPAPPQPPPDLPQHDAFVAPITGQGGHVGHQPHVVVVDDTTAMDAPPPPPEDPAQ